MGFTIKHGEKHRQESQGVSGKSKTKELGAVTYFPLLAVLLQFCRLHKLQDIGLPRNCRNVTRYLCDAKAR
jgi:hypothetical protein